MADSTKEITKEQLQKEIADILDKASLNTTSTKKVIQTLESKLGVDLTEKKKMIDQLVMEYVNNMDSEDDDSGEEEAPVKVAPKKAKKASKKQDEDEEDDENDDSNDSDWGCRDGHLLDGDSSDYNSRHNIIPQEPRNPAERHGLNFPQNGLFGNRAAPASHEEDEAEIFGKLTAKKLRTLSDEERDCMMIEINQLFYDIRYRNDEETYLPKPQTANKSTNTYATPPMPPMYQFPAKKVYRVNTMPYHLMSRTGFAAASYPISFAGRLRPVSISAIPKTLVLPSNVPEPVVQEAATPTQAVALANGNASENNGHLFSDVM